MPMIDVYASGTVCRRDHCAGLRSGPVTIGERPTDLSRALGPVIDAPGRAPKPPGHPGVVPAVGAGGLLASNCEP